MTHRFTPAHISTLAPNEIFVFGSNLAGQHCSGAARIAVLKFGAIYGQGVGLQGQSYAIPTMQGGVDTIKPYVDNFIIFARQHPELTFFVTRIGCGIAGFKDEQIAPLFMQALECENIILPKSFCAMTHRFTPAHISTLAPNEIFVFGSNLAGQHGGGAARIAVLKFGAIYGQGVGLQGQSYAIPTMQGGVDTIKPYVDNFIIFARQHPELTFYVTRIGCGIAGFTDEQIAPLFMQALECENIILPKSFCAIIYRDLT